VTVTAAGSDGEMCTMTVAALARTMPSNGASDRCSVTSGPSELVPLGVVAGEVDAEEDADVLEVLDDVDDVDVVEVPGDVDPGCPEGVVLTVGAWVDVTVADPLGCVLSDVSRRATTATRAPTAAAATRSAAALRMRTVGLIAHLGLSLKRGSAPDEEVGGTLGLLARQLSSLSAASQKCRPIVRVTLPPSGPPLAPCHSCWWLRRPRWPCWTACWSWSRPRCPWWSACWCWSLLPESPWRCRRWLSGWCCSTA